MSRAWREMESAPRSGEIEVLGKTDTTSKRQRTYLATWSRVFGCFITRRGYVVPCTAWRPVLDTPAGDGADCPRV